MQHTILASASQESISGYIYHFGPIIYVFEHREAGKQTDQFRLVWLRMLQTQ